MRAEIISVGTELLLGFIVDTNAAYLAQQLAILGVDLYYVSTFGDNLDRLADGVRRAYGRSDLTIVTGGLGPTEDDLTRDAIAKALDEPLTVDPALAAAQEAFWRQRNLPMPPRNLTQAMRIPSAEALPNPLGTAPGWFVERDGRILIAMPGVPREMTRMWEHEAAPRLKARGVGGVLLTRILKIAGKGESAVEHAVADFLKSPNPTIATYAKNDGIHLRLTAKADDRATAERLLADFEARVRPRVADDVYGVDEETLGGAVATLLGDRAIAVADTLTGGSFAQFLSSDPQLARRFVGGLVAATPSVSWAAAAGAPGATDTAIALARLARDHFGAAVGVGVTGAPGPDPSGETPPGAFAIAIDDAGRVVCQRAFRSSAPAEVRRWASYTAENLLWRALAGRPLPG